MSSSAGSGAASATASASASASASADGAANSSGSAEAEAAVSVSDGTASIDSATGSTTGSVATLETGVISRPKSSVSSSNDCSWCSDSGAEAGTGSGSALAAGSTTGSGSSSCSSSIVEPTSPKRSSAAVSGVLSAIVVSGSSPKTSLKSWPCTDSSPLTIPSSWVRSVIASLSGSKSTAAAGSGSSSSLLRAALKSVAAIS